jgi:gluconolactonase
LKQTFESYQFEEIFMSSTEISHAVGLEPFTNLVEGLDHPEGVAWDPDAEVIYAGGEGGQLYAIRLDGSFEEVADLGAFALGVAVDGNGRVYACAGTSVVRYNPSDKSVETFTTGTTEHQLRDPNHPAFGRDGSFYVTDSGTWDGDDGLVFRVTPSGATEVWSSGVPSFPNGCCITPDGKFLVVVQSTTPSVWRIPILTDGSAGDPELVCELPGTVPDGVAADVDGRLYVPCYRPDRIYRVDLDGTVGVLANEPRGVVLNQPTNIAFVGAGLDRVVVGNLGGWHVATADLGVTGLRLSYPTFD